MQKLTLTRTDQNTETCCHHWLIDPVAGAESRGHCSLCGKERNFLNIFEDILEAQQAAREEASVAA
jgi:hypothetical protein